MNNENQKKARKRRTRRTDNEIREGKQTLRQERQSKAVEEGVVSAVKRLVKDPEILRLLGALSMSPEAATIESAHARGEMFAASVLQVIADEIEIDESPELDEDIESY